MQLELFRAAYRLTERVSPKARNIRIEVRRDREVLLVYPRWVSRAEALAFLQSRQDWIRQKLEQWDEHEARHALPPEAAWDGSDEIPLRGARVPVYVEYATLRQTTVRVEHDRITLFAPAAHRGNVHKLETALKRELMQRARVDAQGLLDRYAPVLGVQWRDLSIADPRSQWGSCAPSGAISLSWRLIMAPREVFEYVVIHELCHLLEMNHSERFWGHVQRCLPGFDVQRRWLRDQGGSLHHYLPRRRSRQS
ncbi:MAG: SprT family zinc-dependent metalloprotease [Nevskiales bacterium]|nr:SprT family zinc-dependent metalloprotease [Nevskiales bacterium]